MSTPIIATKPEDSFEYKMKARLRESIGELLSDEDLGKMVTRSMEEIFFTKRPNPKKSAYGYNSSEPDYIEPLLNELVKELLLPAVTAAVKDYVESNPVLVNKIISEVVTNGVGTAVIKAMNNQFQSHLITLQTNIQNQLNK